MSTEITVIERAEKVLAFADTKAKLAQLAEKSKPLTEITNPAGYQQVHSARMDLKNTRVELQKRGKAAREDAQAFAKAVIAKEKELVDVIAPEESRLQALQDEWDAAREAERQAKIEAERKRVADIQRMIEEIRDLARPEGRSAEIAQALAEAESLELDKDRYQEFTEAAELARSETVEKLRTLLTQAVEREAEEARKAEAARLEAERLAAERAELEKLRREQEERSRAEQEKLAEERRRQEEEFRAKAAEAAKAQAEAAARERAAREAEDRAKEAERRAEQERLAEQQRQAREAAEKAERERQEAEKARIAHEIATATLTGAAEEALALLIELGQADNIVTKKLAAALKREPGTEEA